MDINELIAIVKKS